jgi:hypothetical protein
MKLVVVLLYLSLVSLVTVRGYRCVPAAARHHGVRSFSSCTRLGLFNFFNGGKNSKDSKDQPPRIAVTDEKKVAALKNNLEKISKTQGRDYNVGRVPLRSTCAT